MEAFHQGADWVVLLGSDNYALPKNIEEITSSKKDSIPDSIPMTTHSYIIYVYLLLLYIIHILYI